MFSSWCSPFVLAFLWDALPLFVLLTFCFDLVLAVDKKMEYICIELSVYYGHLFFLVICKTHKYANIVWKHVYASSDNCSLTPWASMCTCRDDKLSVPVAVRSYQHWWLGILQASRKKCQTEFRHSGGSEGQFLQSFFAKRGPAMIPSPSFVQPLLFCSINLWIIRPLY